MKIAFFGIGLMGSGFVRRLRANGHEVNVWNRSAAKARKLEAARVGMELFVTPAIAAMFGAAIARGEGALDVVVAARVAR